MPYINAEDGAVIHYETWGAGPRLVFLLHCMGGNVATWDRAEGLLGDLAVRWVAVDFRGCGQSQREACELTNERLAADLLRLADHFRATRFVLIGHSMGAKLALYLAATAPTRVAGLVLLGSPGPGLIPIERNVLAEYFAQTDRRAFAEQFHRPWFVHWPRPEITAWLDHFAAVPDWALLASCEMSLWTDFSARLTPPLNVPALLIAGEHDPLYGPEYQRLEVAPWLRSAQLITVPCGHGLFLELPERIAGELRPFLAALPTTEEEA